MRRVRVCACPCVRVLVCVSVRVPGSVNVGAHVFTQTARKMVKQRVTDIVKIQTDRQRQRKKDRKRHGQRDTDKETRTKRHRKKESAISHYVMRINNRSETN